MTTCPIHGTCGSEIYAHDRARCAELCQDMIAHYEEKERMTTTDLPPTALPPSPWDSAPETPCDWWSIDDARLTFRRHGFGLLPLLDRLDAVEMALTLQASAELHEPGWNRVEKDAAGVNGAAPTGRQQRPGSAAYGRRAAWVAPTSAAYASVPALAPLAGVVRRLAEGVTGRPVTPCPYPESACTVKVYQPGDEQGPHRDSNPLTGLLILRGELPVLRDLDVPEWPLGRDMTGWLAIFQGRRLWHGVPRLANGPSKVVAVYNLYHPGDTWRPDGIDRIIYS